MNVTSQSLVTAMATFALAVSGTACSSGADTSAESTRQSRETQTAGPELATAEFRVKGMTCGGCAVATEMSVEKLDGVESADAEYDEATGEGRCSVTYDPSVVSTDQIDGAIEEAGFTPSLVHTSSGS